MEKQAAEKLGEPVEAGSIISTAGTGKAMFRGGVADRVGGAIGGMVTGVLADKGGSMASLLGHSGVMYLAVGRTKVGFFTIKRGLLASSISDTLGILRREAIASIALGTGTLTSPVTMTLTDGSMLDLEVPRAYRGRVEKIAGLFGRS